MVHGQERTNRASASGPPGGEILAETDALGNILNEYIFFGGKHVAILPNGSTAQFYVEDLLGSSRVITTNTGAVCYDADFYPFSGERTPYTNTCTQNNYKFQGKERDTETGNDDFGARYYSNRFGRWLSSDWSAVPAPVPYANLTNPQTLNLYAMVADDPESFADLDGHASTWEYQLPGTGGLDVSAFMGAGSGVDASGLTQMEFDLIKSYGDAVTQQQQQARQTPGAAPPPQGAAKSVAKGCHLEKRNRGGYQI